MNLTIDKESLAALHRNFPGMFPDMPPKPVPRSRGWFRPEFTTVWDTPDDSPAFSALPAIVGFLPFLEPAVGNPALAKHPIYKSAVLRLFEQAIKDAGFIYPIRQSDDLPKHMYEGCLDWTATASLDDLRRLTSGIFLQGGIGDVEANVTNGMIPAILKRFRDTPRTLLKDLSLLILSFDPMGIDYGFEDEYEPEARVILEKLSLCNTGGDVLTMICEVFQYGFHDYGPTECYASLTMEIWSWFQVAKEKRGNVSDI